MMNWDGSWGAGAWLLMSVMMVLFWAAVAWVVVTLVRHSGAGHAEKSDPPDPLRLLDQRYANGEIDTEEYTRRRDTLLSKC
jgi:putative membrane protein